MILAPLQKLPKNVGDLGKLIVAKSFRKLPKVQKSPNPVTLHVWTSNKTDFIRGQYNSLPSSTKVLRALVLSKGCHKK